MTYRAIFLPLLLVGCAPAQPETAADDEYGSAVDLSDKETSGAAAVLAIEPTMQEPVAAEMPAEAPTEDEEAQRSQKYRDDLDAAFKREPDPT